MSSELILAAIVSGMMCWASLVLGLALGHRHSVVGNSTMMTGFFMAAMTTFAGMLFMSEGYVGLTGMVLIISAVGMVGGYGLGRSHAPR